MHPPQHVVDAIEQVNPNVRLGWTHKKEFADVPRDGAFALLDLYPSDCKSDAPYCLRSGSCAKHSVEPAWEHYGPIYGKPFDERHVPIVKKFLPPQLVFNGDVIGVVKVMSMTNREFAEYILRQNEALEKKRRADVKALAAEMGDELYWTAQRSTEVGPTIANKHITAEEKAKVTGDWEADVPEKKPVGVSGLGLT